MKNNIKLMQGNEACVEGALSAGMRFYAGYPITPSTEIAEGSAQKLPRYGGKFIQMEDEIAGMAAVIGASLTGLKSMTATSGPGFSLKQENIGYAALAEIPCVIVNVQRSGPSTGLPTSPSQGDVMQAKWGTHGDHPIIALSPSSVTETYDLTIQCFNLAEKYRTPVILLLDEVVGHMREKIEIRDPKDIEIFDRVKPHPEDNDYLPYRVKEGDIVPKMSSFGDGFKDHVTGLVHDESGFPSNSPEVADQLVNRLMKKIEDNVEDIISFEEYLTEDAEVILLSYGGTARSAKSAVKKARENGLKVGMFRPITIWPFPEEKLKALAKNTKAIVVAEMNYGQLVTEVERIVKNSCEIHHVGKVNGEVVTPEEILKKVKEAL